MAGGVKLIDCDYVLPKFAASYLMTEGDRALFVENNTAHAVPKLLQALHASGGSPERVDFLVITHVHLDHAGGTSALLRACPNALVLAHPRAARHVIDPSKLVASARKVYGDEAFEKLYGEILPVDASRVREIADGETIRFGSRELRFFHTRGHANHHMCVHDTGSDGVFTGDAFGLAYPRLQGAGLFIFPSTSPTDFDAVEARKSVRRIVETGAKRAWLTHFGEVTDLRGAAAQLISHLDFSESVLLEAIRSGEPDEALDAFCLVRLRKHFEAELEKRGMAGDSGAWEVLKLDVEINAGGLAFVARKERMKPRTEGHG